MTIEIRRQDGLYSAIVSPPRGNGHPWRTEQPLSANELVDRLRDLGCHTTDISDAFYAAYPYWLDDTNPEPDPDAAKIAGRYPGAKGVGDTITIATGPFTGDGIVIWRRATERGILFGVRFKDGKVLNWEWCD